MQVTFRAIEVLELVYLYFEEISQHMCDNDNFPVSISGTGYQVGGGEAVRVFGDCYTKENHWKPHFDFQWLHSSN